MKPLFTFIFALSLAANFYLLQENKNIKLYFEQKIQLAKDQEFERGKKVEQRYWQEERLPRIRQEVHSATLAQAKSDCLEKIEREREAWSHEKQLLTQSHDNSQQRWANERGELLSQVDSLLLLEDQLLVNLRDLKLHLKSKKQFALGSLGARSEELDVYQSPSNFLQKYLGLIIISIGMLLIAFFFSRFRKSDLYV